MKKTLVALAAFAATGAFAQVALTGVTGFQFQNVEAAGGGNSQTYGLHDTAVKLSVTEDLGGGLKITAVGGVNGFGGRNAAGNNAGGTATNVVVREDAYLSLEGGFGTVKMGQYEAGNGIIGRAYAGAPVMAADDNVILAGGTNLHAIAYTSPSFGGLKVSASVTQGNGSVQGTSGSIGVSYDAGALSAGIDYNETTERVRASASYDLGMIKVGAGISANQSTRPNDSYALGVSAPLGAATVGATYSAIDGGAGADAATAIEFGVNYALSKMTSVSAAYKMHNTEAEALTGAASAFRVRLTKAF